MHKSFAKFSGKSLTGFFAVFCILAAVSSVFAQVTAGRVTGSVLDPNSAVVSGASVTLKS